MCGFGSRLAPYKTETEQKVCVVAEECARGAWESAAARLRMRTTPPPSPTTHFQRRVQEPHSAGLRRFHFS